MNKFFVTFIMFMTGAAFADRLIVDTTMAAAEKSEHMKYEDRGSFGPYVEFGNIKMKNVTYDYKIHGLDYDISIDNSYIYGASGSLPLTEWFDIYLMAIHATATRSQPTSKPSRKISSKPPMAVPMSTDATRSTRRFSSWDLTLRFRSS